VFLDKKNLRNSFFVIKRMIVFKQGDVLSMIANNTLSGFFFKWPIKKKTYAHELVLLGPHTSPNL